MHYYVQHFMSQIAQAPKVKPEPLHQLVDLHKNLVQFAPRPLSPFQFSFNSRSTAVFLSFHNSAPFHPLQSSKLKLAIIPRCEAYQAMVHSTASDDQKAELFDSLAEEGFQVGRSESPKVDAQRCFHFVSPEVDVLYLISRRANCCPEAGFTRGRFRKP